MYEILCGSIFESKCDLIIIPCNSYGGVTNAMQDELWIHNLPYLPKVIDGGDVYFQENDNHLTTALVTGFAASVDIEKGGCSEECLHSIMLNIKNYCKAHCLSIINIPLLGTGSGRMNPKTSLSIIKSYFEDDSSIHANIYIYSKKIYKSVSSSYPKQTISTITINPRVFISYASDDTNNRTWVKELACKLRSDGINARVDLFHLKPGQDLPQWMTNELLMADKVLMICDHQYAYKSDFKKGGVGWEAMIIQGDMLAHSNTNKYICIIKGDDIDTSIPIYAKSRFGLKWNDESLSSNHYSELLLHLFDCDIEPPLGPIPATVIQHLQKQKK